MKRLLPIPKILDNREYICFCVLHDVFFLLLFESGSNYFKQLYYKLKHVLT